MLTIKQDIYTRKELAQKEIVSNGLVNYAIITAFEAGCLSEKQSQFLDFYQNAALAIMMAVRSSETPQNQRYKVLESYFERVQGKYGKWADDVIEAVKSEKKDGQRIKAFDTFYVSSMRTPYAKWCTLDKDKLHRIEKRLSALNESYMLKNKIVQELMEVA